MKKLFQLGGDDATLLLVMDILCRKFQNVHAVRTSKVKLWRLKHENVQKALEEKMDRVIKQR